MHHLTLSMEADHNKAVTTIGAATVTHTFRAAAMYQFRRTIVFAGGPQTSENSRAKEATSQWKLD